MISVAMVALCSGRHWHWHSRLPGLAKTLRAVLQNVLPKTHRHDVVGRDDTKLVASTAAPPAVRACSQRSVRYGASTVASQTCIAQSNKHWNVMVPVAAQHQLISLHRKD